MADQEYSFYYGRRAWTDLPGKEAYIPNSAFSFTLSCGHFYPGACWRTTEVFIA